MPKTQPQPKRLIEFGRAVIATEIAALERIDKSIDENFIRACLLILDCKGRIVVTGMGKSGHIGRKIAATFASTGTPSFFVHPSEAGHGDLGMIKSDDVVLVLSNSGETDEIITLLPVIKRLGIPLISLTGKPGSSLAKTSSVNIDVSVGKEACPMGLAPTASTTATLAMGDALAIALLQVCGFSEKDFAVSHPSGALGRRLLYVRDIMHIGDELPAVRKNTPISDALVIMTQMGLGTTAIIDEKNKILGIFTDGDLRRALDNNIDIRNTSIDKVMTRECQTISKDELAVEALSIMEKHSINALPVTDEENKLLGLLNTHDLLRAKII